MRGMRKEKVNQERRRSRRIIKKRRRNRKDEKSIFYACGKYEGRNNGDHGG